MASRMHTTKSVNIDGGATSGAVNLEHFKIFVLHIPASFLGTSMTFTSSPTKSGTYQPLMDDAGNAISITVAADDSVAITDSVKSMALAGAGWVKLVSSTTETDKDVVIEMNR